MAYSCECGCIVHEQCTFHVCYTFDNLANTVMSLLTTYHAGLIIPRSKHDLSAAYMQSDDKGSGHKDKPSSTAAAPDAVSIPASATPSAAPSTTGMATPRPTGGLTRQGSGRTGGTPKAKDTPKTTSKGTAKGSKKTVPASFVEVIDCLVDVTLCYKGMQPGEEADLADPVSEPMQTDEPFTISAQLPDGRMVRVSATHPGRGAGPAAGHDWFHSQGAGQAGQAKPAANASFTEQVGIACVLVGVLCC